MRAMRFFIESGSPVQIDLVASALYALDGLFMPIVQFRLSLCLRYTVRLCDLAWRWW